MEVSGNADEELHRQQSILLREGLEDLMEHIQQHRHEEPVSSLEERYLLLVSSYPPECLRSAVAMTDADLFAYRHNDNDNDNDCPSGAAEVPVPSDGNKNRARAFTQRLPIHLACDKAAPLSIFQSLLEADPSTVGRPDKWGDLPIHTACSRAAVSFSESDAGDPLWNGPTSLASAARDETVETIRLLLEADVHKTTLFVRDVYESLPLHTAVRYNAPPCVVEMLLDAEEESLARRDACPRPLAPLSALYTEGLHGQVPLTVACRSGNPSPGVLGLLLDRDDNRNGDGFYPSTALHRDATGRLPVHVFMLRNTCEVSLRTLLNAMLGCSSNRNKRGQGGSRNSILRIGLDAWKVQLRRDLIEGTDASGSNRQGLYERDFVTRDKLDVIRAELEVLYEKCIALELVVWKNSMDIREKDDESSAGGTPPEEKCDKSSERDNGFRERCRIVGGAEIIVPNVLSWLEDEPVQNILDTFASYGYLGSDVDKN